MPWKRTWTDEQVAQLHEAYASWPPRLELVQGHTKAECHTKAYKLGLTRGRKVGPLFGHVTSEQWAYLAGILDGEGTIKAYDNRRVWVIFVNTDRGLIDWVVSTFPGCSVRERRREPPHKTLWSVTWGRGAVQRELLLGVMPYLIVKRDAASEVIAWIEQRQHFNP